MTNTIITQISGNTAGANEAKQHLIELAAEPGCGLARDSALVATNLLTMQQSDILRVLGALSAATMAQIGLWRTPRKLGLGCSVSPLSPW